MKKLLAVLLLCACGPEVKVFEFTEGSLDNAPFRPLDHKLTETCSSNDRLDRWACQDEFDTFEWEPKTGAFYFQDVNRGTLKVIDGVVVVHMTLAPPHFTDVRGRELR